MRLVAALALAVLAGCAQMPEREGPNARLLPCVKVPRDRAAMDITIHRPSVTGAGECLRMIARKSPVVAGIMALTLAVPHACSRVQCDRALKPGRRPWCIVVAPAWDENALEHELRHCEGWDHPATN